MMKINGLIILQVIVETRVFKASDVRKNIFRKIPRDTVIFLERLHDVVDQFAILLLFTSRIGA